MSPLMQPPSTFLPTPSLKVIVLIPLNKPRIVILQSQEMPSYLKHSGISTHSFHYPFSKLSPAGLPTTVQEELNPSSTIITSTHFQVSVRAHLLISPNSIYSSFFIIPLPATTSPLKPNQLSTLIFLSLVGSCCLFLFLKEQNLSCDKFSMKVINEKILCARKF